MPGSSPGMTPVNEAMDETLDKLGAVIAGALASRIMGHWVAHGELTITSAARDIVQVATFLRDDERCQFWSIVDITAVDWPGREQRFEVVYHFLSPKQNVRIRVKIEVDETTAVPSIIEVFPAPTGSSARPTISTASCSPAIRTCAGS